MVDPGKGPLPTLKFPVATLVSRVETEKGCRIRVKGGPHLPQSLSRLEGTLSFLILTKNPAQCACTGKRGSHLEGRDYAGCEGDPGFLVENEQFWSWEKCLWVPDQVEPSPTLKHHHGDQAPGNPPGFSIETYWHLGTTTVGPLRFLQRQIWPSGRPSFTPVP